MPPAGRCSDRSEESAVVADQPALVVTVATAHLVVDLADSHVLVVTNDPARPNWGSGFSKLAWRVRAGQAIVMVRFFIPKRDRVTSLCDVEVRDGFRGAGLALATIEEVGRLCASPVHTSGSFTPKGFRSLAASSRCTPAVKPARSSTT